MSMVTGVSHWGDLSRHGGPGYPKGILQNTKTQGSGSKAGGSFIPNTFTAANTHMHSTCTCVHTQKPKFLFFILSLTILNTLIFSFLFFFFNAGW